MPADDDIAYALAKTGAQAATGQLFGDYYDGRHRLMFATDQFRTVFGSLFATFADNLCAPVIDAVADKLAIVGWDGAAGERAEQIWDANHGAQLQGELHLDALTYGQSAVIVWPGADATPTLWPQPPGTIAVDYDPEVPGRIRFAAKIWKEQGRNKYAGRWRATLYYDDHIARFITRTRLAERPNGPGQFVAYVDDDDPVGPEVPNPYGRPPVFEFVNNAGVGKPGRSELKDAVPIQDALNKSVADMLVAMEFAAVPQRYAIGVEEPRDPITGERTQPVRAGADRVWTVGNETARLGQFDAANLDNFLNVQTSFRGEMARVTGTPLHYFQLMTGAPPSGAALQILNERATKRIADRAQSFTPTWTAAMQLALEQANAGPAEDLAPRWAPAEYRDEAADLANAEAKARLGIPAQQIFVELGYSADMAEEFAAAAEATQAAAAEAALAAFDRNQPAPILPPVPER